MRRIKKYVEFLKSINIFYFFYLNYFCKSIVRIDGSKIIPYKNAVIDIESSAKIYLYAGDIEVGCDLLAKSKAETRIRLRDSAIWSSLGGCRISYSSTVEVLKNAVFDSQYFTMNSNSTIVVAEKISLGQDVMIGRNVVIYDSDHHQITDEEGKVKNFPMPVVIGDHVWLATNVVVLKGSVIGSYSIVGANSIVKKAIKEQSLVVAEQRILIKGIGGGWNRCAPQRNKE